jgi:hypothetical protein
MPAYPLTFLDWVGTQVEPSAGKKAAGWVGNEKPPAEYFNWLFGQVDLWIKYLADFHDNNVIPAGVYEGFEVTFGTGTLLDIAPGTLVTKEGVKITVDTAQTDFNAASPPTANAGVGVRYDAVVCDYDPALGTYQFQYVESFDIEAYLLAQGDLTLIAMLSIEPDPITYTPRELRQAKFRTTIIEHMMKHLIVGDGITPGTFESMAFPEALMTMTGPAVFELAGDRTGSADCAPDYGSIRLRSGQLIDGAALRKIFAQTGKSPVVRMQGTGVVGSTFTAADSKIVKAGFDWTLYGVGSVVEVTGAGPNTGKRALVKTIVSATTCIIEGEDHQDVAGWVNDAAMPFNLYLSRAGIINATIDGELLGNTEIGLLIDTTEDCFVHACKFERPQDGSVLTHIATKFTGTNRRLSYIHNRIIGKWSIGLFSDVAAAVRLDGCVFFGNYSDTANCLLQSSVGANFGVSVWALNKFPTITSTISTGFGWFGKFENAEHNSDGTHNPPIPIDDDEVTTVMDGSVMSVSTNAIELSAICPVTTAVPAGEVAQIMVMTVKVLAGRVLRLLRARYNCLGAATNHASVGCTTAGGAYWFSSDQANDVFPVDGGLDPVTLYDNSAGPDGNVTIVLGIKNTDVVAQDVVISSGIHVFLIQD